MHDIFSDSMESSILSQVTMPVVSTAFNLGLEIEASRLGYANDVRILATVHAHAFKSQSKTGVNGRSEATKIEIPS